MIADNARVGSQPSLVFPAEVVHYGRLKFVLEVKLIKGNAQKVADGLRSLCLLV
jgi:hypothetical protein